MSVMVLWVHCRTHCVSCKSASIDPNASVSPLLNCSNPHSGGAGRWNRTMPPVLGSKLDSDGVMKRLTLIAAMSACTPVPFISCSYLGESGDILVFSSHRGLTDVLS